MLRVFFLSFILLISKETGSTECWSLQKSSPPTSTAGVYLTYLRPRVLTGICSDLSYQNCFNVCCPVTVKMSMLWSAHLDVGKWLIIFPFIREKHVWGVVPTAQGLSLTKATLGRCESLLGTFLQSLYRQISAKHPFLNATSLSLKATLSKLFYTAWTKYKTKA